jgi:hypothetical protein
MTDLGKIQKQIQEIKKFLICFYIVWISPIFGRFWEIKTKNDQCKKAKGCCLYCLYFPFALRMITSALLFASSYSWNEINLFLFRIYLFM